MPANPTSRPVALVTGAASGIGRATALLLGREGARVACLDVQDAAVKETAATIVAAGGSAEAFVLDLLQPDSIVPTVATATQALGGFDILVNAAGIGGFKRTEEVALADWNRILAVNLTGTFLMCQAAIPTMIAAGRGSIVNISSTAGIKGTPFGSAYAASKGGVSLLTRSLAVEFCKQKIRVNAVCPGGILTPILLGFDPTGFDMDLLAVVRNPSGTMGQPEDVARLIAFLASDAAAYITGVTYPIDGGTAA